MTTTPGDGKAGFDVAKARKHAQYFTLGAGPDLDYTGRMLLSACTHIEALKAERDKAVRKIAKLQKTVNALNLVGAGTMKAMLNTLDESDGVKAKLAIAMEALEEIAKLTDLAQQSRMYQTISRAYGLAAGALAKIRGAK